MRLDGRYDLVLVDCPPSLGRLTRSGLVAAHRALIVTEPSLFAVHGADRAFRAVQEERAHNAMLQPLGVVVNRYDERSAEHRFRLEELRRLFGPLVLNPPLPDRSIVQQAQGMALAGAAVEHHRGAPGDRSPRHLPDPGTENRPACGAPGGLSDSFGQPVRRARRWASSSVGVASASGAAGRSPGSSASEPSTSRQTRPTAMPNTPWPPCRRSTTSSAEVHS